MNDIRKDLLEIVEKMPAFPQSVHRIMELTSDINSDPKTLVEVIQHDPILVMKILRLVNSPYFGLARPIGSISHAVVYIGINTVKNLALSAATLGSLPRTNSAGFDMDAFLLHSLATAIIARILGRKLHIPEKEIFDFFLSGLLHDFGKILFAHFMPREYKEALFMAKNNGTHLHEAERKIFSIDHTQLGSLLGDKWNLPPRMVACLRDHHGSDNPPALITEAVIAADQISKALKIGYAGENIVEALSGGFVERLGTDMQGIIDSLGDVPAEIEKAQIFIQP